MEAPKAMPNSSPSGLPFGYLASSLAQLLEVARREFEHDREAYTAAHVTIGVDNRTRYELVSELRRRWLSWLRAHHPPAAASAP